MQLVEGIPTRARAGGIGVINGEPLLLDGVDKVDHRTHQIRSAHAVGHHAHAAEVLQDIAIKTAIVKEQLVTQSRTAPGLNSHAEREVIATLGLEQSLHLECRRIGQEHAVGNVRGVCSHGEIPFLVQPEIASIVTHRRREDNGARYAVSGHASPADAASAWRWHTPAMAGTFAEPAPTPLALLLLGQQADPNSEVGVECPGALPAPSDPDLVERARAAKAALGDRVFILGHHYQRDEVIQFADVTGDSFKLSQQAAARPEAEYVVFCGVHFMAESADILTADHQKVILPDMAAGCSMADMADIDQVLQCWRDLEAAGVADVTVPITYMNSSAAIKAFTGEHGGSICTSSNAERSLTWVFGDDWRASDRKVLFLPDQHLGRNTAVRDLGMSLEDCVLYDPRKPMGGLTVDQLRAARMILWRGHCSVHGRFTPENVDAVREEVPGVTVIVHPECQYEVVAKADVVGSTEKIIAAIDSAPAGSAWAVGTELNLVKRLALAHPDKEIVYLDKSVCFCSTMNRIDLPHLVWTLESLVQGTVVNQISVDPTTARWAKVALDRMLALPGPTARLD